MKITVKGKEYRLNFGIRFVREIDQKYNRPYLAGAKMGYGLEVLVPQVAIGNPEALEETLMAGMVTEEVVPSMEDLDDFIDGMPDYNEFIDEVLSELKKQNATKMRTTELLNGLEKQKAQQEAQEQTNQGTVIPMSKRKPMPITK